MGKGLVIYAHGRNSTFCLETQKPPLILAQNFSSDANHKGTAFSAIETNSLQSPLDNGGSIGVFFSPLYIQLNLTIHLSLVWQFLSSQFSSLSLFLVFLVTQIGMLNQFSEDSHSYYVDETPCQNENIKF